MTYGDHNMERENRWRSGRSNDDVEEKGRVSRISDDGHHVRRVCLDEDPQDKKVLSMQERERERAYGEMDSDKQPLRPKTDRVKHLVDPSSVQ